jgi:hypothetical protein
LKYCFLSLLYFQNGWLLFLLLNIEERAWETGWVINEYSFSASNKQLVFNVLTNFEHLLLLYVHDAIWACLWGMCSMRGKSSSLWAAIMAVSLETRFFTGRTIFYISR